MDLNATSSIITGGASGIGLATAKRVAALGGRVLIVDMNEEKGEAAAKELGVPLEIINDTAAQGREKYQARLILVRPDQFVAWAADRLSAPAEPARVLRRAIGHLDSGAAPRAATT